MSRRAGDVYLTRVTRTYATCRGLTRISWLPGLTTLHALVTFESFGGAIKAGLTSVGRLDPEDTAVYVRFLVRSEACSRHNYSWAGVPRRVPDGIPLIRSQRMFTLTRSLASA